MSLVVVSSAANTHSTITALLSVFFVCAVLVLVKLVYLKHRRLHAIHALPAACSPLSRRVSLSEKVEHKITGNSYLIGMLGSPAWESTIQLRLDVLARSELQHRGRQSQYLRPAFPHSPSVYSSYASSPSFTELCGPPPEPAHIKQLPSSSTLGDSLFSPSLCTSSSSQSLYPSSRHSSDLNHTPAISRVSSMASLESRQSAAYLQVPQVTAIRQVPPPLTAHRAPVLGHGKRTSYHKPTIRRVPRSSPSLRSSVASDIIAIHEEDKENQVPSREFGQAPRGSISAAVRKRSHIRMKPASVISRASRRPFASIAQTLDAEPVVTMPPSAMVRVEHCASLPNLHVSAASSRRPSPLRNSGSTRAGLHGLGLDYMHTNSCADGCIQMR